MRAFVEAISERRRSLVERRVVCWLVMVVRAVSASRVSTASLARMEAWEVDWWVIISASFCLRRWSSVVKRRARVSRAVQMDERIVAQYLAIPRY